MHVARKFQTQLQFTSFSLVRRSHGHQLEIAPIIFKRGTLNKKKTHHELVKYFSRDTPVKQFVSNTLQVLFKNCFSPLSIRGRIGRFIKKKKIDWNLIRWIKKLFFHDFQPGYLIRAPVFFSGSIFSVFKGMFGWKWNSIIKYATPFYLWDKYRLQNVVDVEEKKRQETHSHENIMECDTQSHLWNSGLVGWWRVEMPGESMGNREIVAAISPFTESFCSFIPIKNVVEFSNYSHEINRWNCTAFECVHFSSVLCSFRIETNRFGAEMRETLKLVMKNRN